MTREEAIKGLKVLRRDFSGYKPNEEMFNMAIKALSQEPSRDIKEIAEIVKCDADAETKCKMISNILTAKPYYFEEQDPCEICGYAEGSPFCLQYCPYDAEKKKEQEPTVQDKQAESEKYQKAFDDGYANGYKQARFDYEQEPCKECPYSTKDGYCQYDDIAKTIPTEQEPCDAISREAALNSLIDNTHLDGYDLAEALDAIENKEKLPSVNPQYTGNEFFNFDAPMVKKSMEQDAISRQAVLDQTYLWSKDEFLRITNPFDYLRKRINSLPPVTPQPKIGQWIDIFGGCECSECGCLEAGYSDYCPNCGAKMESEDKE